MTFYLNVCIQLDLEASGLSIPVKNLNLFLNAFVSNAMHVFPTLWKHQKSLSLDNGNIRNEWVDATSKILFYKGTSRTAGFLSPKYNLVLHIFWII